MYYGFSISYLHRHIVVNIRFHNLFFTLAGTWSWVCWPSPSLLTCWSKYSRSRRSGSRSFCLGSAAPGATIGCTMASPSLTYIATMLLILDFAICLLRLREFGLVFLGLRLRCWLGQSTRAAGARGPARSFCLGSAAGCTTVSPSLAASGLSNSPPPRPSPPPPRSWRKRRTSSPSSASASSRAFPFRTRAPSCPLHFMLCYVRSRSAPPPLLLSSLSLRSAPSHTHTHTHTHTH